MITKWYRRACEKHLQRMFYRTDMGNAYVPEVRNVLGNTIDLIPNGTIWPTSISFTPYGGSGSNNTGRSVQIGSGNTPPTISDYRLENRIPTASYSVSNTSATNVVDGNGNLGQKLAFNVTNVTSENIVIAEIGFTACLTNYNAEQNNVLVDRSLVTPAITIEPNESAYIEYEIYITGATDMEES